MKLRLEPEPETLLWLTPGLQQALGAARPRLMPSTGKIPATQHT
jgi:hypothetical protein